jgi:hypothetical protein
MVAVQYDKNNGFIKTCFCGLLRQIAVDNRSLPKYSKFQLKMGLLCLNLPVSLPEIWQQKV